MIDLLFKCLDAIESYLNNVKASSDEGTEDNELIIKELNDFIAGEENAEKKEEEAPRKPAAGTQGAWDTTDTPGGLLLRQRKYGTWMQSQL